MIELLVQAEASLTAGRLDEAERLYWQAIERDPQNSIAVVGLARVALERGDERTAYEFARRALLIDGENAAAQRLVVRLEEVIRDRGESDPERTTASPAAPEPTLEPEPDPTAELDPTAEPTPESDSELPRGLLDRLLGRR